MLFTELEENSSSSLIGLVNLLGLGVSLCLIGIVGSTRTDRVLRDVVKGTLLGLFFALWAFVVIWADGESSFSAKVFWTIVVAVMLALYPPTYYLFRVPDQK